jgi:N-[(2S)-2-amino-2-carboxyethyl]-L-glutamate dehydrogenase
MIYLDDKNFNSFDIRWEETIDVIEATVNVLHQNDFAQPVKPYLRYRDLKNRIISMPAFVGGRFNVAGIKWIASFPDNHKVQLPRAHSVMIINDSGTGEPIGIINTGQLSAIRTASVSGLMIRYFLKQRPKRKIRVGIIGWGPIGRFHLRMCHAILGEAIEEVFLYDLKDIDAGTIDFFPREKISIVDQWSKAYSHADIFITCTVSDRPYIDAAPKSGSLHLNVSLRDYKTDVYNHFFGAIIVDNWEEVCRENTDIERMYLEKKLQKSDTHSITDVVNGNCLEQLAAEKPILFNPMGMGVFDVAMAKYYLDLSQATRQGTAL